MSTFWKGFAIFWIIFLIWYLTGGPQRSTLNNYPIKNYESTSTDFVMDSNINSDDLENKNNLESKENTKSEKSFSNTLKTNTINVNN